MQKEIKLLFVLATLLVYILILKGKDKNDGKKFVSQFQSWKALGHKQART